MCTCAYMYVCVCVCVYVCVCVCTCVCVCVHAWIYSHILLDVKLPVTCLISENSPITFLLCILDTSKLEYNGLVASICKHSIRNLGG